MAKKKFRVGQVWEDGIGQEYIIHAVRADGIRAVQVDGYFHFSRTGRWCDEGPCSMDLRKRIRPKPRKARK